MKIQTILFTLILFTSCRKTDTDETLSTVQPGAESLTRTEVKTWLQQKKLQKVTAQEGNMSPFILSDLPIDPDRMESMANDQGNYWLQYLPGQPRFRGTDQGYRKVAVIKNKQGQIHARILEIIPDGLYMQRKQKVVTRDFSGRLFIYDENYQLIEGRLFAGGTQIGEIKPLVKTKSQTTGKLHTMGADLQLDCTWYETSYFDAEGVFTVYAERICTASYYDSGSTGSSGFNGGTGDYAGHGGGGGGTAVSSPKPANLPGESGPKVNPKELMNCFNTIPDAGAKMQVTVYVQEPQPGTTFNMGKNSVGHVAIGLTKANGSASITQVIGFYPDAGGFSKMHAPSKIVDNSFMEYNTSITYSVNATNFKKIMSKISAPRVTYDLIDFNCTNFVYDVCQAGNIDLPNPYNTVGLPGPDHVPTIAMTPAGLGDSIGNLKGQKNVNTDGGISPSSKGNCK